MRSETLAMLRRYANDLKNIYGENLKAVILYGSYARGDYNEYSDIDIMILVDLETEDILKKENALYDMTYEYDAAHEVFIAPIVNNISHFNRWLKAYPFYNNVKREGIELYDATA